MNRKFLLLLLSVFSLAACGGKGGDVSPAPVILSVSTEYEGNKAVAGRPVTLNGQNFSPVAAENKVLYGVGFDAIALSVSEAAEDRLVFTAPNTSQDNLLIRVSTRGRESNSVTLTYTVAPEEEEPWSDVPTLDLVALGGKKTTLVQGVEWIEYHGIWEGETRNINVIRATLNEHNQLGIFYDYSTSGLMYLDEKCVYVGAVAGTNGPMACCHFVRIDGAVKHGATEQDYWVDNCALTIDDGVVDIVKVQDNYKAARLTNESASHPSNTLTVGCGGPLLVWNGQIQSYADDNKADFLKETHPRTALGLSKDGKTVVQVAVDGRWTSSASTGKRAIGMPTSLLAKLMKGLGCYKALNFDGGGGTQMWISGKGDKNNIVNHPHNAWPTYESNSGAYYWIKDNEVARRNTGNAVYIKSDLK